MPPPSGLYSSNLTGQSPMTLDSNPLRGVCRLAAAILVQAIEDLRRGSGRKRDDAIHWITESREDEFSFVYCCRILSRDAEEIRRMLLRQSLPDWAIRAGLDFSSGTPAEGAAPHHLPHVSPESAVR